MFEYDKELQELDDLFQSAVSKIGTDDAVLLFRACVHEYVKFSEMELGIDFHLIYGNALFYLHILKDTDAIDLCISIFKDQDQSDNRVVSSLAKCLIVKATSDSNHSLFAESVELVDKLMLADYNVTDLAHYANTYIEQVQENKVDNANKFKSVWQHACKVDPSAAIGLGNLYQILADFYLENEIDCVHELVAATEQFRAASEQEPKDMTIICKMGECYLNLGNLYDEQDAENKTSLDYYQKAVDCFKTVLSKEANVLPEEFVDFVTEFELQLEE
jgi:tetratricopeptide (TPR) repeat protein